jgi:hypothetical protein
MSAPGDSHHRFPLMSNIGRIGRLLAVRITTIDLDTSYDGVLGFQYDVLCYATR